MTWWIVGAAILAALAILGYLIDPERKRRRLIDQAWRRYDHRVGQRSTRAILDGKMPEQPPFPDPRGPRLEDWRFYDDWARAQRNERRTT